MGSSRTVIRPNGGDHATADTAADPETDGAMGRRDKMAMIGLAVAALVTILTSSLVFWLSGLWAELPTAISLLIATATLLPTIAAAQFLPRYRERLEVFHQRPDSEHEQIIVRILMLGVISVFLFLAAWINGFGAGLAGSLTTSAVGQCLSWALLVHLIHRPAQSTPRRIVGIFCDQFVISWWVFSAGEFTAGIYPFLLWATFGHGFRYGIRFLIVSAVVSALFFGLVLSQSAFWQVHLHTGIGLWIGLLILPAYVTPLINRLNRARAQAEEANRAKGRFLATMSHELRTPLTAIIGMGGLLKSTRIDNDQRTMVATVDTSAQSLLGLINDILDFSKVEAGKLSLDVDACDLHEVVSRVWMILHGQAEQKGLRLRVTIDPRAPYRVEADAKRLTQVLINLVGNATKFTEAGEIELAMLLQDDVGDATWLRFEVRDTGIGISPENQASIFEGFTQADDTIGRRYGGTGLGLAISQQMIEMMGGRIGVDSVPGQGSTFWISVPFETLEVEADRPLQSGGASFMLVSSDQGMTDRLFLSMARWQIEPVIVEHQETLRGMLAEDSAMGGTIVVVNDRQSDPLVASFAKLMQGRPSDVQPAVIEITDAVENGPRMARDWPVDLAIVAPDDDAVLRTGLRAALAMRVPFAADAEISQSAGEASAASQAQGAAAQLSRRRILLAEDNNTNRLVITRVLEMAGHEVVPAADGDEALDLLADHDLDIALMDLNMPGTSGLDVVRLHRMSEAADDHLPIVALTADATAQARQDCSDAGMDGYLTKPVEPPKLFAMIERLCPSRPDQLEINSDDTEIVTPISQHPQYKTIVEPVIDGGALDALRALDADGSFVAEVLTEFLADTDVILAEMAAAAQGGDVVTFKDTAHSLRSSANHVGAARMVQMLLDLREVQPDELAMVSAEAVPRLFAEFEEVRTRLQSEIGKPRQSRSGR